jgi:S1-C subfamily serine protease
VVNISAQQTISRQYYDPFGQLFGRSGVQSQRGISNAVGSGVIVSADGYILTNNHVVTGEAGRGVTIEELDLTVTLSDKRELPAKLIGIDPATDLAVLKVDAANLPTMPWADSSELKVAEWVLAIGNPYQLSEAVTVGIVSAVGRTNLGVSTFEDFIQTDAAINPGNSGGALITARGELVGINTVIFSQSGGYQGIGFAVSSNLARRIFGEIRQYGEVRRGSIGAVELIAVDRGIAQQLELPDAEGLLVARMSRASSAYDAGLRPGDVVLSLNATRVENAAQLWRLVADTPIGSSVRLRVRRGDRTVDLTVPVVAASRRAPVRQ